MEMVFPKDFIVGSATAAYQVEGNNTNSDFWAEEQAEGSPYTDKSGDAIDHYRLYRQDIALMASLGLQAYRFSIEWARVEPAPGQYSESAIAHYKDVLLACYEYGLTPVVAMHHFSSPQWLMRKGGWGSEDTPDRFANYCKFVFQRLGGLIPYALTFNEVNLPVMLREVFSNIGLIPPVGIAGEAWAAPKWRESAAALCGTKVDQYITFHMISDEKKIQLLIEAHRLARQKIKQLSPDTQVGLSMALSDIQSVPGGEEAAAAKWQQYFEQYLPALEGDDFFGLQNYTREVYGPVGRLMPAADAELTQMKYEYVPEALGQVIQKVNKSIKLPIIVTEHGVATHNDERRVAFIRRGLQGVHACIQQGIDVRGYLHWTTFDNFEWNAGYSMTFGLIAVDRQTQERNAKESARYLGQFASTKILKVE
ncbi:beta-glucosidase [Paenibacillus cellulosilyticus]|uniref:Beta-glucosidase n=1 Tax=Paenibacillus cellulosilyticus TaxID=375489 RepID=A0A2V2YES0_9BACL|nr:family 1 glycosylhydrolase [Paenibacillus cellulosilyticus]PWV90995.1 beta-glucosidase [Paenibacillus cellulosilyticus]QKS45209.1 family 1 glycosylhydrolase [Paenibacillus cellulosilyticus]